MSRQQTSKPRTLPTRSGSRKGMAVPVVVMGVILASILIGSSLQRAMQSTRQLDMTYNKKNAYYVAEAGMNHAVKELMKSPFFSRFILRDFVQQAAASLGRPADRPGQFKDEVADLRYTLARNGVKHSGGLGWAHLEGEYGDGKWDVTLVEHVAQEFMSRAGEPGGSKVDPIFARLDHIAVYARGVFPDPSIGETWALLTAKIAFRPEPFLFEYDTDGDGLSEPSPLESGDGPIPAPTAEQAKMSDLVAHPFLHPDRWAVWTQPTLQSPPPTNVSLLKHRVFYQTIKSGDTVRNISELDFRGNSVQLPADPPAPDYFARNSVVNPDRTFIQTLLKADNKTFLLNFGSNKEVRDTFARLQSDAATSGGDPGLIGAGQLDITQGEVETLVDTAAGGRLQNLDAAEDIGKIIRAWIEQYTESLPTRAGLTAYGTEEGQAELELLEDTSQGPRTQFAENLGKVFGIPQAELDKLNELIDAFSKGQIKNGKDLLAKNKPGDDATPVGLIDDLTQAQEYYAPVVFPRGKPQPYTDQVPDGNIIPDDDGDGVASTAEIDAYLAANPQLNGQPPMIQVQRWRIGTEFIDALKGGPVSDPDGLYQQMEQAAQEINSPPVNEFYTADLTAPRPPSFAQMQHTIILKAQNDPRLDIRLKDALKEALKWVEVPGAEFGETGEVAPVAIAMGLSYSLKWKCFCKDQSETEEDPSRQTRRSASAGGVAR